MFLFFTNPKEVEKMRWVIDWVSMSSISVLTVFVGDDWIHTQMAASMWESGALEGRLLRKLLLRKLLVSRVAAVSPALTVADTEDSYAFVEQIKSYNRASKKSMLIA